MFPAITFGRVNQTQDHGGVRLVESVHAPRLRLAKHRHEDASIVFVLDGSFEERIGRRVFSCGPGSVVVKPAGVAHSNTCGNRGARCVVLQFSVTALAKTDAYATLFSSPRFVDRAWAGALLPTVLPDAADQFRTWSSDILGLLRRLSTLTGSGQRLERRSSQLDLAMRQVRDLLVDCHGVPPLAAIARAHGLSASALAHAFRRRYGCSAGALVRRGRVEHASHLLHDARLTLTDVALRAGFADQAHLTREFRGATGLPPGRFRRTLMTP